MGILGNHGFKVICCFSIGELELSNNFNMSLNVEISENTKVLCSLLSILLAIFTGNLKFTECIYIRSQIRC